jgi:hypothetical protein
VNATGHTARDAIAAYIRAKDENRPYLMSHAFSDAATLSMVVKSEAISFPPVTSGREAITNVLVREFNQAYENIRTLCFSSPPSNERAAFSCAWLVGMSAKEGHVVRVGCGRYDWTFQFEQPHLAEKLTITIEVMQLLPPETLIAVMGWLDELPYPWCSKQAAFERAPPLEELHPIRRWLSQANA